MLQYDKNILTKQQAVCHEATTTWIKKCLPQNNKSYILLVSWLL
jgi:hypothetical protein